MSTSSLTRRAALAIISAFALAACGGGSGGHAGTSGPATKVQPYDVIMGDPSAPVTLIEYASTTCPHCQIWHKTVLAEIKTSHIDTGEVRYVFREFPTPPVEIAVAGAAVARCAGKDKYYEVIADIFDNQTGIMAATRAGQGGVALQAVAERHGIKGEKAFEACVNNPDIRKTVADVVGGGEAMGVNSTPTFFINGRKLSRTPGAHTPEGMKALLDEAGAALAGESGDTAE